MEQRRRAEEERICGDEHREDKLIDGWMNDRWIDE